jgi:tetratricopeptide (TPR) repeat protein
MFSPGRLSFLKLSGGAEMPEEHQSYTKDGSPGASAPFRAFVSYSHEDVAFAKRLQTWLETYRIPRRLQDRVAVVGGTSARIGPVFRDVADLSASEDLSAAIVHAISNSLALVVVCSPAASKSPWVAREIALFRKIHPDRPVLAALVAGDPSSAFPIELTRGGAEPLAADFRRSGEGRRLAFLKIVAGVLGVPLDELIQRDGQRRQRRVMAVTAASMAVMIALAVMTVLATTARREAERQRNEAEGLIEFMLTDLRAELKAVGRLDIMQNVNRRALSYYSERRSVSDLPDDSLERRARVLGAMGEDDENGGDLAQARARYEILHSTTEALLAKEPQEPERVFAHAKSENRLALLAIADKKYDEAIERLARTQRALSSIAPWGRNSADWLRQSAFSYANSCAVMVKRAERGSNARDRCRSAIELTEQLLALRPRDRQASYDLVFHYLWLAEAEIAEGRLIEAQAAQRQYLQLIVDLIGSDPTNMLWREQQMELYVRHAELLEAEGKRQAAESFWARASAINADLVTRDPNNAVWARYARKLQAGFKGRNS